MKLILIYIFLVLVCFTSYGQHKQYEHKHEVGMGIGAFNYTGELSEYINLKNTKPALNAFYRYNFQDYTSVLRFNVAVGRLGADEANSKELARVQRGFEFLGTALETAIIYEYNFLNYRDLDNVYFMSPYLYGGIAGTSFFSDNDANTQFASIPFGAGVKFRLKGGWNLGLEAGARKNFTDILDGRDDEALTGSSIQSDWHYFAGVSLSYTHYKLVCPKCNSGH